MSSLVIRLKLVLEIGTRLRRGLTSGFCWSTSRTASIFSAVQMDHLLPELPLLRFRLIPAFKYLLTFLKIVLGAGGLRPGNLT